ncbi:MAG: hypothetical protein IH623_23000 [Verrucomicrobia bacterium]|nr:hypothetical protein [Verrucomicrobiota bacterium]
MTSRDLGRTWTEPQPVPALGRVKQTEVAEEGVCDVLPEWHAATKTVLAVGLGLITTAGLIPAGNICG